MSSFELRLLSEATIGEVVELPSAGTPLEQPWVFDSAARVLKTFAEAGPLEVVGERHDVDQNSGRDLITGLCFKRLR
jgi:hypothetical protein